MTPWAKIAWNPTLLTVQYCTDAPFESRRDPERFRCRESLFLPDRRLPFASFLKPLRLIERKGKEKQLLVALDLQSDRRSRWQSFERTTQTIQRSHRLAIQRANHVSGVQRHFHASPRRASGNDNPKRVAQFRHHRGNSLINLQ